MIKWKHQWMPLRTENSQAKYDGRRPRCFHHLMYSTKSQLNFKLVLSFDVLFSPPCICPKSLSLGVAFETFSLQMDYIASLTHAYEQQSIAFADSGVERKLDNK